MKAIKIKFKLGESGYVYPPLNHLPASVRGGLDWSRYIDRHGVGCHYDLPNMEFVTVVPDDFAAAASGAYPAQVSIISEAELEDFWDNKAHVAEPTEILDTDVLQGILARVQLENLNIAPPPSDEILRAREKCLDPKDQHHKGIRRNVNRHWKDFKKEKNIELS